MPFHHLVVWLDGQLTQGYLSIIAIENYQVLGNVYPRDAPENSHIGSKHFWDFVGFLYGFNQILDKLVRNETMED